MKMSNGTALVLIAVGVTLAYHISNRLSSEALNVVVGLFCGVAASVPVALGLLIALTKRREPAQMDRLEEENDSPQPYYRRREQLPQFIMMAPPGGQYSQMLDQFTNPAGAYPAYLNDGFDRQGNGFDGREWRIIGDDS